MAETGTASLSQVREMTGLTRSFEINWTSDASGDVNKKFPMELYGTVVSVYFGFDATATPDDDHSQYLYDETNDGETRDLLNAQGADLDPSGGNVEVPPSDIELSVATKEVTFVVSGAGNANTGYTVIVLR